MSAKPSPNPEPLRVDDGAQALQEALEQRDRDAYEAFHEAQAVRDVERERREEYWEGA